MNFDTLKKLKECCQREAALRRCVYPKWVSSGKMTAEKANEEISKAFFFAHSEILKQVWYFTRSLEIKLMALAAACFDRILQGRAPKEVQKQLFDTKEFNPQKSMYDWGM